MRPVLVVVVVIIGLLWAGGQVGSSFHTFNIPGMENTVNGLAWNFSTPGDIDSGIPGGTMVGTRLHCPLAHGEEFSRMETTAVGRKKVKQPDPNRKPGALNIKGDPAWRDWVEKAAAHSRMSVS